MICARHGVPTKLTCVECETPICPDCAIRTEVGFKCPDHASRPVAKNRSLMGGLGLFLIVVALLSGYQLVRSSGTSKPATARCPTESAPDVGIGPQPAGGGHWREIAVPGLCGRYDAAVAWTGKEMLVWGGENCAGAACPSDQAPHLGDGAAYTPGTDKWRRLSAAPLAGREAAATAWTGTELLVWGGTTGQAVMADGAAYDPARNRWRTMAGSPLAARTASASAWTGKELLVWGGSDLADGAAYDPATDAWRPIAAAPLSGRSAAVSAWTGREMVVWGGVSLDGNREFADGAAYDPATDKWRPIAASPLAGRYGAATTWTGRELLVWGGNAAGSFPFPDGAAYEPGADRWRPLPASPLSARSAAGAVWTGKEMLVWGGVGAPGSAGGGGPLDQVLDQRTSLTPLNDGAGYDPATDKWRPLETVPLIGRGFPVVAWDGQGMIVWGGLVAVSSPASASDGARYTP
jgi:N-acetylneuraminic acid mutarotase